MMWYRLTNPFGELCYLWYNEVSLYVLAKDIYFYWTLNDTRDNYKGYGESEHEIIESITTLLLSGERDFINCKVEEQENPFKLEWWYWDDWFEHNYSMWDIILYAQTRDDLWEYDNDRLVEFVWSYADSELEIDDILDKFSHIED